MNSMISRGDTADWRTSLLYWDCTFNLFPHFSVAPSPSCFPLVPALEQQSQPPSGLFHPPLYLLIYIYINIYICIASFPSYVYPLLVVICIWGHRVLLEVWMLISLLNQQFYSLCLQDKFCSLGPNLVCSVLPARGDVLMVGHFSGLTVAHTASLVAWKHTTQQNSNNQSTVYVCVSGTEARRQEIQQVVTTMGCKSR